MLISVIIPTYNVQNTIERTLESVFNQEYKNIEILCVDDGSADNTVEILKKYIPKIRILIQENKGASAARNLGILEAKGEFIQFLDADDVILPNKIKHQVALLSKNKNQEIYFIAASSYIYGSKKTIKTVAKDIWEGLLLVKLGNTCSNLFSKKIINDIGLWDTKLKSSQEYDLMFRIVKRKPLVLIDETPNTVIYQTPNSISSIKRDFNDHNFFRGYARINDVAEYMKKNEVWNEYYQSLYFQKLFQLIKFLYNDYPEEAIKLFHSDIPKNFLPSKKLNSLAYICAYKILGFKKIQKYKNYLKRLKF